MSEDILFYDSPETIKQCLSCTRTKCSNCMRIGGKGRSLKSDKINQAEFMDLYEEGMNDIEIANYFGVTQSVVKEYRKKRGLPSKQPGGRGRKKHGRS